MPPPAKLRFTEPSCDEWIRKANDAAPFPGCFSLSNSEALRDAPEDFGEFHAGWKVRTPRELVRHMTSVLGYARTFFRGGQFSAEPLPAMQEEVRRFHDMLSDLSAHLDAGDPLRELSPEQLLQGPFADAMTHAGQLAMLRRMHGSPVPPENFVVAAIDASNVGSEQAAPRSPDELWPERP